MATQLLSALPIDQTIRVARKRVARFLLTVKNAAGTAQDISGDTFTCQVCDAYGGNLKLSATCTIATAASGTVNVVFAAADVDDGLTGDEVTSWVYTLDRTHGGEVTSLFAGAFEIHPVAKL